MKAAFALGARGLGRVWPNPAVGCVIVKDGRVLGRGWTQPGGRPHAEVVALGQAGDAARGATAYVTLEPCAHHGKTGPCSEALVKAGVARVVGAITDPDERVTGKGYAMLKSAGIDTVEECLADVAEDAHLGFFTRVRKGRPMLTLKLASSLDGRIATSSGDSRWITGPTARRQVHGLRANHDAVLIGSGTMQADDPDLRVRDMGAVHQPVRVVADRRLQMDPEGQLAKSAKEAPVWALHGPEAKRPDGLINAGVELIETTVQGGALDIPALMHALADKGLTRVFCEGGGTFAAALLTAGCVDRLVTFGAGVVIGAEGQPNFGALGMEKLSQAPRFRLDNLSDVDGDIRADWRPA